MKNYTKPHYIPENLEAGERRRLHSSISEAVDEKTADDIMALLPLEPGSTAEKRAEWVENMSAVLENNFDGDTVKLIRSGCYCNENGQLERTAERLRRLYLECGEEPVRFVSAMNEKGAGWHMENGVIYTKMFSCPCPMLEKAEVSPSLTWCHCTAGYNKKLFETVFEREVRAEIMSSIRQGNDYCVVRIELV